MTDVENPSHYVDHYPFEVSEAIELILNDNMCQGLSPYQFYCLGNMLKYRFRAGLKGDAGKDIAKALKYKTMMESGVCDDIIR